MAARAAKMLVLVGLPTVATATAAVATTAAAIATAAAVATAAAAIAAAAVATAAAAIAAAAAVATTTAARITRFAGFRFFDHNGAAIQICFVECLDSVLCFIVVRHFHKAEAFGTARHFIVGDGARGDLPKLFEGGTEIVFDGVVVQFCYENVHFEKRKR